MKLSETGYRLLLLSAQIVILILCVSYINYIYIDNILPDKEAKETFATTSCLLMSKKLTIVKHVVDNYRGDFLVSYNVNGAQYNRWVSGNGLDMSSNENRDEEENTLAQYAVGSTYTCYYNPTNPEQVILVLRHNWLSTLPLLIPSVVFIMTLYYFIKNVFLLLIPATIKTRELIDKRKKQKISKDNNEPPTR